MKVIKRKKSSLIIPAVIAAAFYAAALYVLLYSVVQGVRSYAAYCVLVPALLCIPMLLTVIIIAAARSYFVFGSDYFEYHTAGKSILITARNLRYFTFSGGLLTVYFIKETLESVSFRIAGEKRIQENTEEKGLTVQNNGVLFKIGIPAIGLYEHGDQILAWFYKNLPLYADGQALEDLRAIENRYKDIDYAQVQKSLVKAERIAKTLNLIGILLGISVNVFHTAYRLTVFLCAAYPVVMLFLLHFSNGWIRFDKKGNSIYPSIALSLIACTFGLAWRMLAVYSIIDVKKLFFIAAVFYSAYFILFLVMQKEYSFKNRYAYAAALVYSVYFLAYALSAVTAVNCAFDPSSPVATVITENRQEKTVYTYRGLLGILWRYDR